MPSDPSRPAPGATSGAGGLDDKSGRPAGGHEAGACRGSARPGEHPGATGAEPQPGPAGQSEHRAEVRRGDTSPGPGTPSTMLRPAGPLTHPLQRGGRTSPPPLGAARRGALPGPHQLGCRPFPRLLAQLNETEAAFDEFWAKHQQKLEQCLQLRHFEQDFREVSGLGAAEGAAVGDAPCGNLPWPRGAGGRAGTSVRRVHPTLPDGIPAPLFSCFTAVLAVPVPSPSVQMSDNLICVSKKVPLGVVRNCVKPVPHFRESQHFTAPTLQSVNTHVCPSV